MNFNMTAVPGQVVKLKHQFLLSIFDHFNAIQSSRYDNFVVFLCSALRVIGKGDEIYALSLCTNR